MFMRLVTPSSASARGASNARCKRAINDVRPKGVEGRAPPIVEAEGRPAVGARDHKHVVTRIFRLVARSQRRSHARDGRVAVDDPHASAGREGAPLREGLILDTVMAPRHNDLCTDADRCRASLSEAADRPPQVRGAAEAVSPSHNERHVAGRPDALPRDVFHLNSCDYAGIRLAAACTHAEARQEQRLSASLGEDFRRQRVVDARAHDGSGRSQHISQLTSSADCAALRVQWLQGAASWWSAGGSSQVCDADSDELQWMLHYS